MIAALKKLLKDLLYTGGNQALDIARLSALGSSVAYWVGVFILLYQTGKFDPVEVGTGWGLLCAGNGGWVYARQSKEAPAADAITRTAKVETVERRASPEAEMAL